MDFLILLPLLLAATVFFLLRRGRACPPGPPWVPLLGSLPFLDISKGLLSWVLDPRVTAHPLTQVRLGAVQINVINDLDLAKELFEKDEFSGKNPTQFILNHRFWNNVPRGIIFTQGTYWSVQRRFSLKTLKDFGFGRKSIEDSIHSEVDEMIDTCFTSEEDVLLGTDFNIPIINVLWQIVASKRFSPDNAKDMQLIDCVTTIFKTGPWIDRLIPLPLFYLLPRWLARRTMMGQRAESIEGIRDHVIDEVKKHQEDLDPQNPRDYIDVYLLEERKEGNNMNMLDLYANIQDFFSAGTETSSTTLKWIVQYLVLHQDVQDRCRAEIQRVVGEGRATVGDMPSLPYLQASIAEVQRIAWVAPISLTHWTTTATRVGQYTFPAKSVFVANLAFITNDPRFFQDPHRFNPDRFFTSDGRFVRSDHLVPFGMGKRDCMGDMLARNEVFLFTAALLQQRRLLPARDRPLPDPGSFLSNLTRIPDNFYLRVDRV